MANTIALVDMAARYIPAYFRNKCQTLKLANRPFDAEYGKEYNGYNIGSTLNYRLPNYVNTRTGVVFQPSALTEIEKTITLDKPIGYDWNPSLLQLTTDMDSNEQIMDRAIMPGVMKLANDIDKDIINGLMTQCYNVVGTAGGTVGSWPTFHLARTQALKLGIQGELNALLNLTDSHYLQSALVNYFNKNFNEKIGVEGVIGETGGLISYETQNLNVTHTNGTFANGGSVTIKTTAASGATTLTLQGFTPGAQGVLNAGDIIHIANVYSLNKMNQQAIGASSIDLQGFIVQSAVNADGSGEATVSINPVITCSAGNPNNNVSQLPQSGAAVTLYGGANATYTNNFILAKDAILFAMKPYFKPYLPNGQVKQVADKETGVEFTLTQFFEGFNYINCLRLDGLYGFNIQPDYVIRLIG